MAKNSLDKQKSSEGVKFYPQRFEKIFVNWMENIEDWCISRQLWWGHRIPAYYHKQTGEVLVSYEPPKDIENYVQDEDVLDTWFSSALWPFATLGWPDENSPDFKRYYPNDLLVTAYDIIFFWVSRMMFQALEFTHKMPFKDVLIHGLIRDEQGRKMSKSLGNGIDPLKVIDQYGADALRFFLTTNSAPGLDFRFSNEKISASWNFINKIWNATRFVLMNLPHDFEITSKDIFDAAEEGDALAHRIFDYTGTILGRALADFIVFSSPEAIVLFGGLAKAGHYIMDPVRRAMDESTMSVFKGKTKLLLSELKDSDAAVLGAAALGWEAR